MVMPLEWALVRLVLALQLRERMVVLLTRSARSRETLLLAAHLLLLRGLLTDLAARCCQGGGCARFLWPLGDVRKLCVVSLAVVHQTGSRIELVFAELRRTFQMLVRVNDQLRVVRMLDVQIAVADLVRAVHRHCSGRVAHIEVLVGVHFYRRITIRWLLRLLVLLGLLLLFIRVMGTDHKRFQSEPHWLLLLQIVTRRRKVFGTVVCRVVALLGDDHVRRRPVWRQQSGDLMRGACSQPVISHRTSGALRDRHWART